MQNFALFPKIMVKALKTAIQRSYGLFDFYRVRLTKVVSQPKPANHWEWEKREILIHRHKCNNQTHHTNHNNTSTNTKFETQTLSSEHNLKSSKHGKQDRIKNVKIQVSQNQLVTSVSDAESCEDSKNHS